MDIAVTSSGPQVELSRYRASTACAASGPTMGQVTSEADARLAGLGPVRLRELDDFLDRLPWNGGSQLEREGRDRPRGRWLLGQMAPR